MLKNCRTFFSVLLFLALLIFSVSALSKTAHALGGAGKWAEVCCGPNCGVDYCTGIGNYTCCK